MPRKKTETPGKIKPNHQVVLDLSRVFGEAGYKINELLHFILCSDEADVYYHVVQTEDEELGVIGVVPSRGGAEIMLSLLKQAKGEEVKLIPCLCKGSKRPVKERLM